MADDARDAITEEEIAGEAPAPAASPYLARNAFSTLMASKRKASPSSSPPAAKKTSTSNKISGRDGLNDYILHPETYSSSRVIYHNDSFVAINDLYPKSSVHTLLLPRSKHKDMHPFDAFDDPVFLAAVREEVKKLRHIVAKELQRKYGPFSKQDEPREKILRGEEEVPDDGKLPIGRDWEKEVLVGVHAHPSMNHLHVHVLSKDRYSECLKHRKHYNSFATAFFVRIEEFPLSEAERKRRGKELSDDMVCWRCGQNFGNKFARLKEHLNEEFEEWKRE